MYTDEYLDYWADEFVTHQLYRHGLTLLAFLRAPAAYMAELQHKPFPPLGIQLEVRARVDELSDRTAAAKETLEDGLGSRVLMRDGRLVEPLKHHAWNHN